MQLDETKINSYDYIYANSLTSNTQPAPIHLMMNIDFCS